MISSCTRIGLPPAFKTCAAASNALRRLGFTSLSVFTTSAYLALASAAVAFARAAAVLAPNFFFDLIIGFALMVELLPLGVDATSPSPPHEKHRQHNQVHWSEYCLHLATHRVLKSPLLRERRECRTTFSGSRECRAISGNAGF